jgi:osmotically-inducible protein OsmY
MSRYAHEVNAMTSDAAIQQAVIEELTWDTRVDATDVGVEVDQGVVTLTGTVDSYAKRLAAQEAAHRVAGVLDVANDIRVHLPGGRTRTDTEIAQAVRHALEWDALVPDERIQSTVTDGWVTLAGTVDSWSQREDAEVAVRRLAGVHGVTDAITITAPRVAPDTVRQAIESALSRRAVREADRIRVTVRDNTVTLTGIVHSWEEKRAVVGAAAHAPGVAHIDDQLRIMPLATV